MLEKTLERIAVALERIADNGGISTTKNVSETTTKKATAKKPAKVVPITEDDVPEGFTLCPACEGTKKQSKGNKACPICKGKGYVEEAEEEEEAEEKLTVADVRKVAKKLVAEGRSDEVRETCTDIAGVRKVSELDEDDTDTLQSVITALETLLSE